jgi:hypothetical protein
LTATRRLFSPIVEQPIPTPPAITPPAESVVIPHGSALAEASPPISYDQTPSPQPRGGELSRTEIVPPPRVTSLHIPIPQPVEGASSQPSSSGGTSGTSPRPLSRKTSRKLKGVREEDRTRFAELLERDKYLPWPPADDVRAKVPLSASLSKLIFQFTEDFDYKIKSLTANRRRSKDKINGSSRSLPEAAQNNFVGALQLLWVQELRRYFQRIVQLENYGGFPPHFSKIVDVDTRVYRLQWYL